jgi:site-specific recombinase XerD
MRLAEIIEDYIIHKRSLGMVFGSQAVILRTFAQGQGTAEVADISPKAVRRFLDGNGPFTHYWSAKYSTLKGLYEFALHHHHINRIPLPARRPALPEDFEPYIYTPQDIRRLLEAVPMRHRRVWKLEPHTIHALLLLLYGTGLRISEAVGLTLADFDIEARLLTIRRTKFFKSRLVPLGAGVFAILRRYVEQQWPTRRPSASTPLLSTREAKPVSRQQAEIAFQKIREAAGVSRPTPARYEPRLHDFRHTFAVVRLLTWYREGKDVQRLLPQLSTYLGHYKIQHTQRYLTMTAELLQEASTRFELYARQEVNHVR